MIAPGLDSPPRTTTHLRGVDGLRALAATSVLAFHVYVFSPAPGALEWDVTGIVGRLAAALRDGLPLFFVLSGFLLYRPFARVILTGERRLGIPTYLRNRALRILPAYWVILAASAWVLQSAVIHYQPLKVGRLTEIGILARDFGLVQGYSVRTVNTGIAPAWSLSVEIVFYLLLPILAWAALPGRGTRHGSSRASLLAPAFVLVGTGLATGAAIVVFGGSATGFSGVVVAKLFPSYAGLFGLGMVAAVVHVSVETDAMHLPDGLRSGLGFAAAAALAVFIMVGPIYPAGAPLTDNIVGLICAAAILSVTLPGEGHRMLRRILESRPVATVGLWSYSVYLWHFPVIFLLRSWGVESHNGTTTIGCLMLTYAVTLVLSAITFYTVELPMLRRKRSSAKAQAHASVGQLVGLSHPPD